MRDGDLLSPPRDADLARLRELATTLHDALPEQQDWVAAWVTTTPPAQVAALAEQLLPATDPTDLDLTRLRTILALARVELTGALLRLFDDLP